MVQCSDIKIFSGNSNRPLAEQICGYIGVELCRAIVDSFPDGETTVTIRESIRGGDVFIIQSCDYPTNHNYMELLIMIDAARRASAGRITVVLPFFGYARQDRKDRPRVPVTAKLIANLLVAAGANRILTMDLHAQQIVGFFDIPVDHLFAAKLFIAYLSKTRSDNLIVCSPDLGGMKMAAAYADALGCGLSIVAKRRINGDSVQVLNIIGEVSGKNVLLTDDMAVTLNTLNEAAKLLKSKGARNVRAAVSHCLLTAQGYERLCEGNIDELITTNSTGLSYKLRGKKNVTHLNVNELLGEAIIRVHGNTTMADLFAIKGF
ncbi:MAG: ribose-phosphate pyrophosphokinase [Puniceicoccales bacterium]|jgi:ribose-phosphate pyrophosphokinase|nr:ribose-phosphate pyrophosphokinase [Puniceicoccales bacterium]